MSRPVLTAFDGPIDQSQDDIAAVEVEAARDAFIGGDPKDVLEAAPGEEAVAVAQGRAHDFVEKYGHSYPKAADCLFENLSALTAHPHFPVEHRERIRHSNLLERTHEDMPRC